MTFYQQRQEHKSKSFTSLLISLMLISFFIITLGSGAQDATPVDNINPAQSEPAIRYLSEDNALINITLLDQPVSQCRSQPSWWNWLLSASSKPANFHYIDFLELLN
ncbi:MAG: hypothetical protein GY808_01255 [Gammaproteobacteria bacterium]|nr:hypothetical protein [Gammaproteobacteria bacterium]